ncbi:MAG: hypothetical protein WBX27_15400, partial [Specibacter sp.]
GPSSGPAPVVDGSALLPEDTAWGRGLRLPPAVEVDGVPSFTDVPALGYGSAAPAWPDGR